MAAHYHPHQQIVEMAFDVVAASYREQDVQRTPLQITLRTGLLMGFIAVFACSIGLIKLFNERWIIDGVVTLGQATLVVIAFCAGLLVQKRSPSQSAGAIAIQGLLAGAITGGMVSVIVLLIANFKLRFMFVALSKSLLKILTFKLGIGSGIAILIGAGALLGLLGALIYSLPYVYRRSIVIGLCAAALVGLFQELLQLILQITEPVRALIFTYDGLRLGSAIGIFIVTAILTFVWTSKREHFTNIYQGLPPGQQKAIRFTTIAIFALVLLVFPYVAGNFIGQVFMLVGLYILMGMGLNLELGLAGLLDLGFVAFFAVGAYTTALLTANNEYAIAGWSYWQALPVAVGLSLVVGVLFGVPVLKVRGDYLAVATLGLGEIVRVLVISDMAEPVLGGAQGLLSIPRPLVGSFELDDPVDLFYLTLVSAGVVAFFAWRLENSRLGRAWTAIRDDEDVAQALGINLVNVKLLAYGLGAAFAGVAGSIFAVMLGSIFPHSFQLLISINVLALLIVGGMGSIPGVIVGAAMLIGMPELLREFGEFRFLFYGIVIVVMMRIKAEGLWPSAARKRELQEVDDARTAIASELRTTTPSQ